MPSVASLPAVYAFGRATHPPYRPAKSPLRIFSLHLDAKWYEMKKPLGRGFLRTGRYRNLLTRNLPVFA